MWHTDYLWSLASCLLSRWSNASRVSSALTEAHHSCCICCKCHWHCCWPLCLSDILETIIPYIKTDWRRVGERINQRSLWSHVDRTWDACTCISGICTWALGCLWVERLSSCGVKWASSNLSVHMCHWPLYQACCREIPVLKWHNIQVSVTFCTTDPTPTPSLLKTLHRCIVDHQTLPVICSLFPSGQFLSWPESSSTLLYAKTPLPYPRHFTCQQTPLNTCILTQHLGLRSRTEQIPYVQFSLSHVCLIIPHAICKSSTCSLPFVTCHVSSLQYISFKYLSCISPVSNINSSSPSFLTSPQKSNLSIWNQGHIGDGWHNTYIEA